VPGGTVLLGEGTRLLEHAGGDKIRLERLRAAEGAG
jgi:hypothetical protein